MNLISFRRIAKVLAATGLALFAGLLIASSARAQELPKPSEQHELLSKLVGVWDIEVDFYPAGPSGPKMTSKAKETNKMLGDFFVISEFEGEIGGLPFKGHGTTGFDPTEKKYVGTWCDSMGPYIMNMKGTLDEKTHTLTFEYESTDPATGQKVKSKNVDKMVDNDTRTFEMYSAVPGSKEMVKMMEARYKRASK
jgi:hypothetical protein